MNLKSALLKSCSVSILIMVMFSFSNLKAQPKGSVLIQNGTVITVTGEDLENTDILVRDGVITQIAQNISAPRNLDVIDASGKYILPGIIDAHSHLNGVDINEGTAPVNPEVTMFESINPNRVDIYRALAGGVTTINLMHGSANVIGGRNVTLKLRYGANQQEMIFNEAPQTVKFALGENPMRVHGEGAGIQPLTRMGVETVIREHFDAALDYRKNRDAYLEKKEDYDRTGQGVPPVPVAKNLRMEVLADIIDGNIIVHAHSYRSDEILMLARVFDEYGITGYTFQHANEAFKVASELAEYGAHASIFADWWAYKFEVYFSTAYSPVILTVNGVKTSINSDSNAFIRHLNLEAAKALRYGQMSKNDALRMITYNPAVQLGIDDYVGSIEVGKQADLGIWNAHPLSVYAINEMTLIDGVVYFNRDEDEDDMRLDQAVNPTQNYDDTAKLMYETHSSRNHHACVQDMYFLFDTEENRHAHHQQFHNQ